MIRIYEQFHSDTEINRKAIELDYRLNDEYNIGNNRNSINKIYSKNNESVELSAHIFRDHYSDNIVFSTQLFCNFDKDLEDYLGKDVEIYEKIDFESCDSYLDKFAKKVIEYVDLIKNDPKLLEAIKRIETGLVEKYVSILEDFIENGHKTSYNYLIKTVNKYLTDEDKEFKTIISEYFKNKKLCLIDTSEEFVDNLDAARFETVIIRYIKSVVTEVAIVNSKTSSVDYVGLYKFDNHYYWYDHKQSHDILITDKEGLEAIVNSINKNKKLFKEYII